MIKIKRTPKTPPIRKPLSLDALIRKAERLQEDFQYDSAIDYLNLAVAHPEFLRASDLAKARVHLLRCRSFLNVGESGSGLERSIANGILSLRYDPSSVEAYIYASQAVVDFLCPQLEEYQNCGFGWYDLKSEREVPLSPVALADPDFALGERLEDELWEETYAFCGLACELWDKGLAAAKTLPTEEREEAEALFDRIFNEVYGEHVGGMIKEIKGRYCEEGKHYIYSENICLSHEGRGFIYIELDRS